MAEMDAFERRVAHTLLRYADEVVPSVDAAAVAHRVALEHPRRRAGAGLASLRLAAVPRVAWLLLLAVALLAALAGTALVASRLLETAPRVPPLGAALVPTGIDVLSPETGWYARVVADGDGVFWAREDVGRLVRYDPATGSGRSWSVSDDAAFSTWDIAAAGEGGVWLVGPRTLRWFDGEVFRQVIEAPVEIASAVEAPDGSLWVTTGEGAVLHWDGSSWNQLHGGRPSPDSCVTTIAVDAAGRPWIGGVTQVVVPPDEVSRVGGDMAESGWVSRYDGSSWTTFDADDAAPLECPVSIAQLADGAVWVAASCRGAPVLGYEPPSGPAGGLARFDGSSWTDATAQLSGARNTTSVAAGPDGTIWAAAGDPGDGAVTVRRFDGRSWISYGPSDGLPGAEESGFITAWALPTKDGVYVGTGAGIYRLNGDRWERAWPTSFAPMDVRNLLAVSRDELWATDIQGGLWHFQEDTWTRDPVDPSHPRGVVHALALAPDGTVWAAGPDGVAYRRDGQWVIADAAEANVIAIGRDETAWVGSSSDEDCRVATLRFDGGTWVRRAVSGCPPGSSELSSLAVDANGALWVAWFGRAPGCGWLGCPQTGLARLDGQSWQVIRELGGSEVTTITIVGATPTGEVWVVDDPKWGGPGEPDPIRAARFDGTDFTVVAPPGDHFMTGFVVAPDGSLWTTSDRGPARCDDDAWTFPYETAGFPQMEPAAVAPDGTVFGSIGSVLRLPDRAPPP